jgi:hypothetical protein
MKQVDTKMPWGIQHDLAMVAISTLIWGLERKLTDLMA